MADARSCGNHAHTIVQRAIGHGSACIESHVSIKIDLIDFAAVATIYADVIWSRQKRPDATWTRGQLRQDFDKCITSERTQRGAFNVVACD
jgi:hypothetical protein